MAGALAPRDLLLRREHRSSFTCFDWKTRPPFPREGAVLRLALRSCSLESKFHGRKLITGARGGRPLRGYLGSGSAQMTLPFAKAMKWWEKGLQSNMNEIESAEHLVESLTNSGDKLIIVHFFSPGCAGCRALHAKICQFAELNPEILFLQINYEEHKSMCYSLRVHVLPFFRFYRGAHGRLCSFSCTNATIKKFKDALAKHNTERCSLGPARGLEETELLALAANKDLSFTFSGKHVPVHDELAEISLSSTNIPVHATDRVTQESEHRSLAAVGR